MVRGLYDRGSIPGRDNDEIFSLRHRVQTGSGAHPVSSPMVNAGSYPGSLKLTTHFDKIPNRSSWSGA